MVNEWSEFLQYTSTVTYAAKSKRDASYLGRFTWDTLVDFEGLVRVLTILARGFLFHEPDGGLAEDPRGRLEYARRALCAWCSVPDAEGAAPREEWRYRTDFRDLHGEFPNLVDEDGGGWFWRHIRQVGAFVEEHPEVAPKTALDKALAIEKGFDAVWRKKVIQFQTPLFSSKALGLWLIRFESVLADGLEQGPLRREDVALPPELVEKVSAILPRGLPPEAVCTLIAYYAANRPEDTDWVVLPVANFDAYFGNTSFGRKWLQLRSNLMDRPGVFFVLAAQKLGGTRCSCAGVCFRAPFDFPSIVSGLK